MAKKDTIVKESAVAGLEYNDGFMRVTIRNRDGSTVVASCVVHPKNPLDDGPYYITVYAPGRPAFSTTALKGTGVGEWYNPNAPTSADADKA